MIPVTIFWIVVFIIVAIYDWKTHRIPDIIIFPCLLVASIFAMIDTFTSIEIYSMRLPMNALFSGAICGAGFCLLFILIAVGYNIGGGDVKYVALIGFVLGYPAVLVAFLTVALSGIITAWIMVKRGFPAACRAPYGVFLSIGGIVGLLLPENILRMVS